MNPRKHVNPGDPLRLAASQINGLNALLEGDYGYGAAGFGETATPYTWVMCRPVTTVARWGVLAITGMVAAPTSGTSDATTQFEMMPVVTGGTPSDTTTAWGVAVEPIESGKIGRLAVGGVVQCKVEVTAADDKYVACKSGGLKTGSSGEGLVLWKESGTGSGKWAIVRLGGGAGGGIKRGTFTGTWTKGSTKTVTDATATSVTYANVKNYIASLSPSGTMACSIAYVGDEWILVDWDWHGLTGYSGSATQVLAHDSSGLKWISTTDCDTP